MGSGFWVDTRKPKTQYPKPIPEHAHPRPHPGHKRYGAIVVADAIDLAVEEGEALGIIGPNGAGKTSLFNLIAGTVCGPMAGR